MSNKKRNIIIILTVIFILLLGLGIGLGIGIKKKSNDPGTKSSGPGTKSSGPSTKSSGLGAKQTQVYDMASKRLSLMTKAVSSSVKKATQEIKDAIGNNTQWKLVEVSPKTYCRMIEKLQRDGLTVKDIGRLKWSNQKLIDEIGDYIRFSVLLDNMNIPDENYFNVIMQVINKLTENSPPWRIFKCKSFLPFGDGYTGVNIVFSGRFNGYDVPVEIQFHTKDTKLAKNNPIIFSPKTKVKSFIQRIYEDFESLVGIDNYNPCTKDFLQDLVKSYLSDSDEARKFQKEQRYKNKIKDSKVLVLTQHKVYRLYQILTMLESIHKLYKDRSNLSRLIPEISRFKKNIFKQMLKNERKSVGAGLSHLQLMTLDKYLKFKQNHYLLPSGLKLFIDKKGKCLEMPRRQ